MNVMSMVINCNNGASRLRAQKVQVVFDDAFPPWQESGVRPWLSNRQVLSVWLLCDLRATTTEGSAVAFTSWSWDRLDEWWSTFFGEALDGNCLGKDLWCKDDQNKITRLLLFWFSSYPRLLPNPLQSRVSCEKRYSIMLDTSKKFFALPLWTSTIVQDSSNIVEGFISVSPWVQDCSCLRKIFTVKYLEA